jgi:RNA polymerase sigma-70 factor (ECF subfamily)
MNIPVEPKTPFDRDFADVYKTHYRRVFSLCRYLLNSFDAAEDATHEVFMRAHRKLATYDPSLPFSSWLAGIASNHCIDLLRRRTTEKRIFDIDGNDRPEKPSGSLTPLNELIAEERGHDVRNALSQLPEKFRVPLVLAYYSEMSYDEIGAALGLARNNVATLIFRGKQQLREKLGQPQSGGPKEK